MSYHMSFAKLVHYDPGQPSITVAVTLSLSQDQINCEAKSSMPTFSVLRHLALHLLRRKNPHHGADRHANRLSRSQPTTSRGTSAACAMV